MQDLSPEDRYQLRKAQMDSDKKNLEAQRSQQELGRLLLELEHKYGLLGMGRTIDPRTAAIEGPPLLPKGNGREPTLALEAATAQEAKG